jgi:hypothetical protein
MEPAVMPTSESQKVDKSLSRWQQKLLPFMAGSLIVLGFVFFAATLWHYKDLQQYFQPPALDLREELHRLDAAPAPLSSPEYKDWYARALLEEMALQRRYQQNSVGMQTRIWTRLMGFLTGMVLVFSGCIFILGKLREDVQVSGDIQGAKWALVTSSPGIVLALAGTALIALAIYVPTTVESTDSLVYLPVQAKVQGLPAAVPEPQPMEPPTPNKAAGEEAPLPPDVEALMQQEAARSKPAPKDKDK